jgi:hypothetical protein
MMLEQIYDKLVSMKLFGMDWHEYLGSGRLADAILD